MRAICGLVTLLPILLNLENAEAFRLPSFGMDSENGIQLGAQYRNSKGDGSKNGAGAPFALDSESSKGAQQHGKQGNCKQRFLKDPFGFVTDFGFNMWENLYMQVPFAKKKLEKVKPLKPKKRPVESFDFHITDEKFPNHRVRMKSTPEKLGVDKVKQYTGYLDIEDEDKHFFYWFFESRNNPETDPLVVWLNGGPGCSSLSGLFFELGPSSINSEVKPVHNPHSWNNNASVIFLEQPVNVGYSYSLQSVTNTVAAGKDVYAFLELFFKQFPKFREVDFHIAGESYGGHYVPQFALEILKNEDRTFNLTSVLIGNGMIDTLTQYSYYEPMGCGQGGVDSVFDEETCESMNRSIPTCLSMIESCYKTQSAFACVPATLYCNDREIGPFTKTGKNVYDMRGECEDNQLCYVGLQYVSDYLNKPEVLDSVGAEVESYEDCNFDVHRSFVLSGDWMRPYQRALTELLEKQVPVLLYAGDKDFICNWLGVQATANALPWYGQNKYQSLTVKSWEVNGKAAGQVKSYDHLTFLRVYEAGHMVPYNQPENALAMLNTWLAGKVSLSSN